MMVRSSKFRPIERILNKADHSNCILNQSTKTTDINSLEGLILARNLHKDYIKLPSKIGRTFQYKALGEKMKPCKLQIARKLRSSLEDMNKAKDILNSRKKQSLRSLVNTSRNISVFYLL